ncbi:MAG TPA: hypothetical protein H9795_11015 [Candidatus Fournierella merdigallinarum]|nr:hypothetical protein [Candidatus Fournierella merdigallinarum]
MGPGPQFHQLFALFSGLFDLAETILRLGFYTVVILACVKYLRQPR